MGSVARDGDRKPNPFAKPRFAMVCPEMLEGPGKLEPRELDAWYRLRMSKFGGIQFGTQRGKGHFFATYDELAEVFGCKRRWTVEVVGRLDAKGWLHIPKRAVPRKDGAWANVYVLIDEAANAAKLRERYRHKHEKPQVSAPAPVTHPVHDRAPPVHASALQGRGSPVEDPSYPKKQVAPDASVASLPSDRDAYFVSDHEAVQCSDGGAATPIISSPAYPDDEQPATHDERAPDSVVSIDDLIASLEDLPGPDSYLAALRPYKKS